MPKAFTSPTSSTTQQDLHKKADNEVKQRIERMRNNTKDAVTVKNGLVITIINDKSPGYTRRPGNSQKEYKTIRNTFEEVHCEVLPLYLNLKSTEISNLLNHKVSEVCSTNYYDCIIIIVISQYYETDEFLTMDGPMAEDRVINIFTQKHLQENNELSERLMLLPKLFIFQTSKTTYLGDQHARRDYLTIPYTPLETNQLVLRSKLNCDDELHGNLLISKLCYIVENQRTSKLEIHTVLSDLIYKSDKLVNETIIHRNIQHDIKLPEVFSTMTYKLYLGEARGIAEVSKLKHIYETERKGKAVIFLYNACFDTQRNDYMELTGSKLDCQAMKEAFEMMNFDVTVNRNFKKRDIGKYFLTINNVNQGDSCLVIAFLTLGYDGYLCTMDQPYREKDIIYDIQYASAYKDKPKLFIFQACRPIQIDSEIWTREMEKTDETERFEINRWLEDDRELRNVRTSIGYNDILMLSSNPGYASYRDPYEGSWMIQALCSSMKDLARNKTVALTDVLIETLKKVSLQFNIMSGIVDINQLVSFQSTLTKTFLLKGNESHENSPND